MEVIVVGLPYHVTQHSAPLQALDCQEAQHCVIRVNLAKLIHLFRNKRRISRWNVISLSSSHVQMTVNKLGPAIERQHILALSNKKIEKASNELLSSDFQTHPQLVLVIDFHFFPQIPSHMQLYLQSRVDCWDLAGSADGLVPQFAFNLAGLATKMGVLAFWTKSEGRHEFSAILALSQNCRAIFVYHDFLVFEDERSQLPIIVKYDLKIFNKMLLAFVQLESVSEETAFDKCFDLCFGVKSRYRMEQGMVLFEGVLRERIIFMLRFHVMEFNIIYPQIMTAKPFGSKIIDNHTSYRQFLGANSPIYNERMKRIIKKDFTQIRKAGIFQRRDDPTSDLFFFWASKYNSNLRDELEDYIVQEIDHFYNNFEDTYALVYVHSSIFDFLAFRKMLEKWPEHFFQKLRRVYIMGPSIIVRLVETFSYGTFYRLCDQIFLNVDSEEQLKQEDLNLLKAQSQTHVPPPTKVYKDSIKIIQNELYGKKIDEYDLYFGRYPNIILELLRRLLKNPLELRVQGIFRRSCDHDQLERLERQIIAKKPEAIDRQEDVFVVAGCLKKILNNLSHPLFNYNIYNKIRDFTGGDEMALIKGILNEMEYSNHKTFVLLLVFLTDYVVSQQEYNKMSSYNLAVIFGPCFFRPKEYDLKDLIYSGKFAKVLVTLFDRQEELIEISERKLAKGTLEQLQNNQIKMK